MKSQFLKLGALLLFLISVSCEKQEQTEAIAKDFFITKDLSFLLDDLPESSAKGWPANGCRTFDVTVNLLGAKIKTTMEHCCVRYACNLTSVNNVLDSFFGKRSGKNVTELEIISSRTVNFKQYDIRIHPGTYQLDAKSNGLKDLEYEVWVNTP